MRTLVVLGALAGCADPAVSLNIQPPPDQANFDTSCVTTFEMYADGANYPADTADFNSIEITLDHPAPTYAELLDEVRGKFDIPIPATGLSKVEVYGWNGVSGFGTVTVNPELAFLAVQQYAGDEDFTVPLIPNMSCARGAVKVRALDLPAFLATSPRDCAAGALPGGSLTLGTLTPAMWKPATYFWGGVVTADLAADGTATMQGSSKIGPESCIAASGGITGDTSTSCMTGPGVCGKPGEYELAVFGDDYYANSVDKVIQSKYQSFVIGAVFDTARASVAGASVEFDTTKGQVVYADFDPVAKAFKPVPNATATTASGIFLLYTNELLDVKVTGAGHSATVRLGTVSGDGMVSTIVL